MNTLVEKIHILHPSGTEDIYLDAYSAIHYLASIDLSWYDETRWDIEWKHAKELHERDILSITKYHVTLH